MLNVLEIHRMSIHNGPGIRTMVHLKGCPLRCVWCSTPESQLPQIQLARFQEKCVGCGKCVSVCPEYAIRIADDGKAKVDFLNCTNCMLCAESCYSNALRRAGYDMSVQELFTEICKDRLFFDSSGGGVVFSGGEPMLQAGDELFDLLRMLKQEGISVGIDTSGYAAQELYEMVFPCVDFFLWDIKQTNEEKHRRITGVGNRLILSNLFLADREGKRIYLRCPMIPGYTDDQENLKEICRIARQLKNLEEVHLIAFHHMGTSRYQSIGRADPTEALELISDKDMEAKKQYVRNQGLPVKIIH